LQPEEIETGGWFSPAAVSAWIAEKGGELAPSFVAVWREFQSRQGV
jgi:hypothetical protein